jgi:hypothetical protein
MRSAAARKEDPAGPDTGTALDAAIAELRAVLRKPVSSPAAARELADIGVTLLEIRAEMARATETGACDKHLADIGRMARPGASAVPAPRPKRTRARNAGQPPLRAVTD